MRIKYAITACDSNPMYYEFWPQVSRVWKELLNIEPILIFIGEDLPKELENNKYGEIIKYKPIPNVPTATQSQFIRFWYTKNYADDIVITTDIDMFPLSRFYFIQQLKQFSDDKFVFLSFGEGWGYNICYNVALGGTFHELLELDMNFETTLTTYYDRAVREKKNTWFLDEMYLEEKLKKYEGDKFIRLVRQGENRINRTNWIYNSGLIKLGMYYDCHSIRPYKQYKQEIDKLINYIF